MQQSRALCERAVNTELVGYDAREMRDLNRMYKNILTVARTVFQAAEHADELAAESVNADLKYSLFARLLDRILDLALRLFDHLLDTRGMDTAVVYQLFERQTRHLAADGVEARERYCLGGIVYDKVNARQRLYRADISTLSAYDPALHIVAGQRNDRYGYLGGIISGAALNSKRNYLLRLLIRVLAHLALYLDNAHSRLVTDLALELLEHLLLSLLCGKSRDLLELCDLGLSHLLDLLAQALVFLYLAVESLGSVLDVLYLAVERLLLGDKALLESRELVSSILHLSLAVVLSADNFFFCLKQQLLFLGLGCLDAVLDYLLCLLFGCADLVAVLLLSLCAADKASDSTAYDKSADNGDNKPHHVHP